MNVLSSVASELYKNLLGCLEVFPWALGSNIYTAVGIAGPAVLSGIEEIVRVHVGSLLMPIVALTVEPVLRLQG